MDDRTKFDEAVRRIATLERELATARAALSECDRRAERDQRLTEALAFNERVIAAASVGIGVYDASGQCVLANEAAARAVGATREDLLHQNFRHLDSWRYSGLLEEAEAALATSESRTRSIHTVSSFGRDIWLDCHFIPFVSQGEPHLLLMFDDVTERKHIEQALRESEQRLLLLTDALPVLVSYVDSDERYRFANEAYERWFGVKRDQLIGHSAVEIIGEDAYQQVSDYMHRALAGERVHYLARMPYAKGPQRDTEAIFIPHCDENTGKVLGFYALVQDVSELMDHKRAEEALRINENRYRALLENMDDAYALHEIILDDQGKPCDYLFLEVNPAFEKVLGLSRDKVVGKRVLEIFPHLQADWIERYGRVALTGEPTLFEQYSTEFGRYFEVSATSPQRGLFAVFFHDVTERKQSEETIRLQSDQYAILVSTTLDGYWMFDREGKLLDVNEAYCRMTGYTREELLGFHISQLEAMETPQETARHIQKVTRTGFDRFETCHRKKNGEIFNVEVSVSFWSPRDRFLLFARDITARKRAEEALRSSEALMRVAQRLAHVGSWEWDIALDETRWSDEMFRILERAPGSISTSFASSSKLVHPGDMEHVRTSLLRAIETGEPFFDEYRVLRPDGTERIVESRGEPVPGADGKVVALRGAWLDITERKKMENALQQSERLLRTILENLPVGVSLFDHKGTVIETNPAMERIWGGVRMVGVDRYHEYRGWWADTGIAIEPHAWASARAVERGEISINEVLDIEGFDGIRRTVLNSAVPVRDAQGRITGAIAVVQDISEVQRAERALREANRRLENMVDQLRATQEQVIQTEKIVALGTMAAGIAHELNNPLMGVMGYVNYAHSHPNEPKAQALLANAEQELVRMRDLIRSMLSFARPSEGKPSLIDVSRVIAHVVDLLRTDFKTRGITAHTEVEEGLPLVIARPQLEQVIFNLLLNARDAVTESNVKNVSVRAWEETDSIFVEVADSGPGISDSIRNRIFDPFFTTKPTGEGTGLGLSVSRTVIEGMGGKLMLASHEGEGARFLICLCKARLTGGESQESG